MSKLIKTLPILIFFLIQPCLLAAEDLYYTYAGPAFSGGLDYIEYNDWFADEQKTGTKKISGNYYSFGAMLDIFIDPLIGEFTLEYISNTNSEVPVSHMIYSAAGKFFYQINEPAAVTAGAGLYLETPPASRAYNSGGGFNASIGSVFSLTREWKVIFDITAKYGAFGIGEESARYSFGARLGIVYKVGRI